MGRGRGGEREGRGKQRGVGESGGGGEGTLGTSAIKKAGVIASRDSGRALQNSKQISKWRLL